LGDGCVIVMDVALMSTQSSFLQVRGDRELLRGDEEPSTGFDLVELVAAFVDIGVVSLLVQSTFSDESSLAHAVVLFLLAFVNGFGLLLLDELVLLLAALLRGVGLSTSSTTGDGVLLMLASTTCSGLLAAVEGGFIFFLPDFGASSPELSAAAAVGGAALGFFFFTGLLDFALFFVGLLGSAASSTFFF